MANKKPYIRFNVFLAKVDFQGKPFNHFLSDKSIVQQYNLDTAVGINGQLFVKKTEEKEPIWRPFIEQAVGGAVNELCNKSSSAVLLLKEEDNIFAFSFGYGRFLIENKYFEQDFGIKTALNTLRHDSLRSVDLFSLDDQALQKKAQAVRASEISVFGIDISKDILRAVTGIPKTGVPFSGISGGDSAFSYSAPIEPKELPKYAKELLNYYSQDSYKDNFSWVDNIRRIKDESLIEKLEDELISALKTQDNTEVILTLPDIPNWDDVQGFSFTRSKKEIIPELDSQNYLDSLDINSIEIKSIKQDKLFVHDVNDNEQQHSIFKCIYFEFKENKKTYILFGGTWYEVDDDFSFRIENTLNQIPISSLNFPKVYTWEENEKPKIENEGDYNTRAAGILKHYLLDKRLVKSNTTTSPIELCDLLSSNGEFIHVKHRKGGSSSLSHLFAQGNIAAEVLLGDRNFRKSARKVLRKVDKAIQNYIPIDGFKSSSYEIVFLVLGQGKDEICKNLPFFSKVNLSKTYENLTQRGYRVSISGAKKMQRP